MSGRITVIFCTYLLFLSVSALTRADSGDCVIILHGMGRTSISMLKIETELKKQGFHVFNQAYPSLSEKVETFSRELMEDAIDFCDSLESKNINFVTHSLGGIVVRYYLQKYKIRNLKRIVMMAPPNKGSEVVDKMKHGFLYKIIMGPNAQDLGTDEDSLPNRLKPIAGEIGIIAGEAEFNPWFLPEIPGADDGKVAVERTKLAEMKDFIIVESGHTSIMMREEVIHQTIYFLNYGRFDHQL